MDLNPAELAKDATTEPRTVTILGSTGSVGSNTVELIENNLDSFAVEALTANRNAQHLAEQARRLKPKSAVLADPEGYKAHIYWSQQLHSSLYLRHPMHLIHPVW